MPTSVSSTELLDELFYYLDEFSPLIFSANRSLTVVSVSAPDASEPSPVLISASEFSSLYSELLSSAVDDPAPVSLRVRAFRLFSVLLQEAAWDLSDPGSRGYRLAKGKFIPWD